MILGALIVVVVGAVWATRYLRVAENRREAVRWMDDHAATRWITAFARRHESRPALIGDRLTPGGTFGLEFTSLMAVLAVALFVLVAYIVVIGKDPGPTPGDETAIAVAEALHCGFMTGFSKVFTFLGSGGFVWPLTAVCAAALAWRQALDRGLRPARRDGADPDRLLGDQGGDRPAAARPKASSPPTAPPSRAATPPTR